jgi:DNA-binding transcriptional LysR family regulator
LSAQIKALENELGVSLFARTSRNVSLTKKGETFLSEVRLILGQLETAVRHVQGPAGPSIRLGTTTSIDVGMERVIMAACETELPDAGLTLVMLGWGEVGQALRTGRVDVGFVHTPPNSRFPEHEGLMISKLCIDPRVAVVRVDHELAERSQLSIRDLNPFSIVRSEGVSRVQRDWWAVNPRPDGSAPKSVRGASSVQEALGLVALYGDVSLTCESAARVLKRSDVRFIPVVDVEPAVLGLAWSSSSSTESARGLVEIARKAAADA